MSAHDFQSQKPLTIFLDCSSPYFETASLCWTWGSPVLVDWPVSKLQRVSSLLLSPDTARGCCCTWDFWWILGLKLRFSCLQSKSFTGELSSHLESALLMNQFWNTLILSLSHQTLRVHQTLSFGSSVFSVMFLSGLQGRFSSTRANDKLSEWSEDLHSQESAQVWRAQYFTCGELVRNCIWHPGELLYWALCVGYFVLSFSKEKTHFCVESCIISHHSLWVFGGYPQEYWWDLLLLLFVGQLINSWLREGMQLWNDLWPFSLERFNSFYRGNCDVSQCEKMTVGQMQVRVKALRNTGKTPPKHFLKAR